MQIGVDVPREGDAVRSRSLAEQLLRADREEVEVRKPQRRRNDESEQRGHDLTSSEVGAPGPDADRDQRLADGDDHDQPVALDEMRRL